MPISSTLFSLTGGADMKTADTFFFYSDMG